MNGDGRGEQKKAGARAQIFHQGRLWFLAVMHTCTEECGHYFFLSPPFLRPDLRPESRSTATARGRYRRLRLHTYWILFTTKNRLLLVDGGGAVEIEDIVQTPVGGEEDGHNTCATFVSP